MKSVASHVAMVLTGIILLVATILLATSRLEYCGQPEALRPRVDTVVATKTHWPTLSPPQKMVFIRVETDKPDVEIGWAEN